MCRRARPPSPSAGSRPSSPTSVLRANACRPLLRHRLAKLEPHVLLLLGRDDKRAHLEHALPDLHVALAPAQARHPRLPHRGKHGCAVRRTLDPHNLLQLGKHLHPHHHTVCAVVTLSRQRRQLGVQNVAGSVNLLLCDAKLVSVHGENGAEESALLHVLAHRPQVVVHCVPPTKTPRSGSRHRGNGVPRKFVRHTPLVLRKDVKVSPIAKRVQAAHAPNRQSHVQRILALLTVVHFQRFIPLLQLLIPGLVDGQFEIVVLLRIRQDTSGGLGLLQLVVYADQGLDCLGRLRRVEFDFLVMERLCIGMTAACVLAEGASVDRKGFVVVLHVLSKVEKCLQDLRGNVWREQRRLEGPHQLLLVLFVQLGPARHERGVEQLAGQGVVHIRKRAARAQCRRRRLAQQFHAKAAYPLDPVFLGGPLRRLPCALQIDLVHVQLLDRAGLNTAVLTAERRRPPPAILTCTVFHGQRLVFQHLRHPC
eukprot:Opistho-2@34172